MVENVNLVDCHPPRHDTNINAMLGNEGRNFWAEIKRHQ